MTDTEYLQKLGSTLRHLRKELQLSQEKFSLNIGMDRTYYASVESGKRNISIVNLRKISDGLGLKLSDLFAKIDNQ